MLKPNFHIHNVNSDLVWGLKRMYGEKDWLWPTATCEGKLIYRVCVGELYVCVHMRQEGGVSCSPDRCRRPDLREWAYCQATKVFGSMRGKTRSKGWAEGRVGHKVEFMLERTQTPTFSPPDNDNKTLTHSWVHQWKESCSPKRVIHHLK